MEAITREEKLMDGQYVEPITRKEKILAGEDLETITREEYFLKKYRGGGGGATVEPLSVTENGTYTAPTGKAYSPVTVAVEGYAKKSIENTPTPIATFNASALPMPSLSVGIEAVQSGTGDPSPTNVRPFSGWSAVNVTRCGKNLIDVSKLAQQVVTSQGDLRPGVPVKLQAGTYTISAQRGSLPFYITRPANNYSYIAIYTLPFTFSLDNEEEVIVRIAQPNISSWDYVNLQLEEGSATTYEPYNGQTYTIDLGGTRYGGTLDVVSGVLTVDRAMATVDENSNIISGSGGLPFRIDLLTGAKASSSASALTGVKCNFLKEVRQSSSWGVDGTFSRVTTDAKIVYFKVNSEITTIQQLKTFLQSNNLQFVYELATPLTIQLTPTAVKSLLGTNNIWADSGDVLEGSYFKSI